MEQGPPLIATIVGGIVLAFILAAIANRLRISPIVGYLLAGVVLGPFTPGFVADAGLAGQLAEIGVILLMFGVGLHFSVKDLLSVRAVAVPGAILATGIAAVTGWALARLAGWDNGAGVVFGLALSVASTVVVMRALAEHHLLDTDRGRVAVGWLIVEDLLMVFALVLLPALANLTGASGEPVTLHGVAVTVGLALGKVVVFIVVMLVAGRRLIPLLLHYVAHSGSRELFRLAVLAIALGIAYGAAILFDVSFALGAFVAGMVLAESPLSQQAAQESLPLRDAFAVLFFVSVGMLVDPAVLTTQPWLVLGTVVLIIPGKAVMAWIIVRALRRSNTTALTVAISRSQIGEFSFILAGLGISLGLLPTEGRDVILAGSILSIIVNPLLFNWLMQRKAQTVAKPVTPVAEAPAHATLVPTTLSDHAVVVGYGRVGRLAAAALHERGMPVLVIEDNDELAAAAAAAGLAVLVGNSARSDVIEAANLEGALWLLLAIPNAFEAGQVVVQARAINANLPIVARAHSDAEVAHLKGLGADHTIMGEREIALGMVDYVEAARLAAGTSD